MPNNNNESHQLYETKTILNFSLFIIYRWTRQLFTEINHISLNEIFCIFSIYTFRNKLQTENKCFLICHGRQILALESRVCRWYYQIYQTKSLIFWNTL